MDMLATALPALSEAWGLILSPVVAFYLVTGVLVGLAVGIIPGLGGIAGMALVLPFLYGMDPISGLAMMVGLVAVIPTSDTFASVLLGIPGSAASQATVLDGFPMSKKGQAARALAAAFTSSLVGGVFGAAVLSVLILVARPLVLAVGLPQLLLLTVLGFSMVAILSGNSPLKGIIAAGLGMTLGSMGEAPALGSPRLDFGSWYLQDGISLVVVGIGIFALPEIVSLLRREGAIAGKTGLGAGWMDGVRDWWSHRWLSLRCASIGVVVGMIPGLGAAVVDWIAYGHTVQTARDRSEFGKGDVRGVIGPESSNNAKEGGALVPTLLFGIPGSGAMAVLMGGMVLLGYQVGPQMLRSDLPVTYTFIWLLALANVIGAGLCIFLSGGIARLTTIRFTYIAPFLLMMISFAAFQAKQTLWDLAALLAVGLLGIFMRRFGWSRPAFLIGFVLAAQAEIYTYQVVQIAGTRFRREFVGGLEYLFTPVSLVLIVVVVASIWMGVRQQRQMRKADMAAPKETGTPYLVDKRGSIVFAGFLTILPAIAFANALTIGPLIDKVFPLVVGGVTTAFALLVLWRMRRRPLSDPLFHDEEIIGEDANSKSSLLMVFLTFIALLALTALFGFIIASVIFFLAFLRISAKASWARTLLLTLLGIGGLLILAGILNRDFPQGLLQEVFDLPWPIGGR